MKYIIFLVNETTIMVLGGWGGKGPLDSTEVFHIFFIYKNEDTLYVAVSVRL